MNENEYGYEQGPKRNSLAVLSICMGVLSLITCSLFYLAIPFGALAIIFACLSAGKLPMEKKAKAAIICSIIGIVASSIVAVMSFYTVLTDKSFQNYLEQYLQYYTGDSSITIRDLYDEWIPNWLRGEEPEPAQQLLPAETEDESESGQLLPSETETESEELLPSDTEKEEETEKRIRLRTADDTDDGTVKRTEPETEVTESEETKKDTSGNRKRKQKKNPGQKLR